jgi:hypothetical protein
MQFNYDTIKDLAKERGCTVPDLLAMARTNDPFYVGCPADIRDAEWFANVWRTSEMHDEHLRAVHYWLISDKRPDPYRLPRSVGWKDPDTKEEKNTDVYINNKACWLYLERASMKARDLGMVNPDEIADNRSPDPELNASFAGNEAHYSMRDYDIDIPHLPRLPDDIELAPDLDAHVNAEQPYLVEIWIEKSTLEKMLVPLCRRYGVNLIVGIGYASATSVRKLVERVREANRPTRILYISDYDDNGRKMPPAVARRIEFYQRNNGGGGLDIALNPIVLTAEQIAKYNLPKSPDDGKSVELDAMKQNYPDELREIIESAILRYHDKGLAAKEANMDEQLTEQLDAIRTDVIDAHQAEIDTILAEYKGIANEINGVVQKHGERFYELRGRLRELSDTILSELEQSIEASIEFYNYVPTPKTTGDHGEMLYKSGRDYLEQLAVYKARGSGDE